MSDETKKVALPAYLLKRLEAFRIVSSNETSYILRDKLQGKAYDFEAWQFFVLEVLPGCEDYAKLMSVFQDRFGQPVTEVQLREFLGSVADRKLFAESAESHPLLHPFTQVGYEIRGDEARPKSFAAQPAAAPAPAPAGEPVPAAPPAAAAAPTAAAAEPGDLPAGINEAVGFDPRATRRLWKLFDPRPLLGPLMPLVRPLRHIAYLMPLLVLAALFIVYRYPERLLADLEQLATQTSFLQHLVFSMLSVNLLNTLMTAFIAHRYRATVEAVGIGLVFGFVPRFMTRISHLKQLTRSERMWLHGAPLLLRLLLLSAGLLTWYNTRDGGGLLPELALGLTVVCTVGLLLSANPLVKSSAYHLLAAFVDEPHLRGKAYKAFLNRWHGKVYRQADSNALAGYALATFIFMFVVIAVALLLLGRWLHDLQFGGLSIVVVAALAVYLFRRTWKRFERIDQAYERSQQFDRWRRRAVPEEIAQPDAERETSSPGWRYARIAGLLLLLVLLFLPYRYEAGGEFTVFPAQQLVVSTDVAGMIKEVYFDGGESVAKGVALARLASDDLEAEVDKLNADLQQQQSVINDLKARPKPEAVAVAQAALVTARSAVSFSSARAGRVELMYRQEVVALEELEAAKRQARLDLDLVTQREADLALAKLGATPDEIAAAEARLAGLREQREAAVDRISRTTLRMPIDGNILSLRLTKRVNSFLDKGQPFASVEDPSLMSAEIEVPESDLRFIHVGSRVEVRATAYFSQPFEGQVKLIDRNVTSKTFGSVVKVIVLVKNPDGLLRTGMRGYAKIDGATLPVWEAFTMAVTRFFQVHVWSWLP